LSNIYSRKENSALRLSYSEERAKTLLQSLRKALEHGVHSPYGLGVSAESTTLALGVEKVKLEKLSHRQEWTL